jgi:hypothetical protein
VIELELDDENTSVPYQLWSPIKVLATKSNIPTVVEILGRKYYIETLTEK